jgi:ketosteroid isomerase-like protein
MAHPNAELLRKAYDAFNKGDMDFLRQEVFAEDVVAHAPGKNSLAGDYKGVDEVFSLFEKLFERTGGTFQAEIHAVLADDEHGAVFSKGSGQREGKTYEGNTVELYHFRNGKVSEFWPLDEDQYAWDEFLG